MGSVSSSSPSSTFRGKPDETRNVAKSVDAVANHRADSSMTISRRLAVFLLAAVLAFTAFNSSIDRAEAHANQVRSSPSPDSELDVSPDRIIVWFSEPIEAGLSDIRVLDGFARQVDNNDSSLSPTEPTAMVVTLPALENGTYTVVWRNVSTVDGHRVIGSFRFAVGEPLAAGSGLPLQTQPLLQTEADPFLRWIFFVGALTFAGVLAFDLLVVRPSINSRGEAVLLSETVRRIQRVMFRLMLASVALMVFGLLAHLVQQASVTFEVSVFSVVGSPLRSVLESDWGRQWTYRMLAVVIGGMFAVLAARSALKSNEPDQDEDDETEPVPLAFTETIFGGLALAAGIAVLGLTSYSSHNAAAPADVRVPAIFTDFIHLLAASLWFGGLFYLAVGSTHAVRHLTPDQRASAMRAIVPRFSSIAFASAITLIATGIVAGYMQVTIPAATATPYGWALVAKLILIVPVFSLAAVNSYVISRKVFRDGSLSTFKRFVRAEAFLALLVLLAVGWLAGLEPARQYAARNGIGVSDARTFADFVEGADIDLSVEPGQVGQNTVSVTLRDRRGDAIDNATDVRVRLKFLEDDLGESLMSLEDQEDGAWSRDDFNISIGGVYQAELLVVRPGAFDARTSFRFDAASTSGAGDAIAPTRSVAWTLFGLEILAIGFAILLAGMPKLRKLSLPSRPFLAPAAMAIVVGAFLLLNAQVLRIGYPEDRFNPFPISSESIEMGRVSYQTSCAACHGVNGLGDGPQAAELDPPPADLRVHVPLHTDSDLFGFIKDGVPGTAMPGQDGILTEDEMWRLVNFLRTFES